MPLRGEKIEKKCGYIGKTDPTLFGASRTVTMKPRLVHHSLGPGYRYAIWLIPQMSATFRAVFGNFEKKLIFITPRGNKYLRFFQNSVLTVQNQLKSY